MLRTIARRLMKEHDKKQNEKTRLELQEDMISMKSFIEHILANFTNDVKRAASSGKEYIKYDTTNTKYELKRNYNPYSTHLFTETNEYKEFVKQIRKEGLKSRLAIYKGEIQIILAW